MPTVLRTFPQVNRSGTQQTAYFNLPNQFNQIELTTQTTDAVHSDPLNGIRFEVLYSANGTGSDEQIFQVEQWTGGVVFDKRTQTTVPNAVDSIFGPIPATGAVALRAIFNRTINIGATLTGLP